MIEQYRGYQIEIEHSAPEWQAANNHALPFFQAPKDDLCLWRLSLAATTPVLDLPYPQYVDWQGAQRWLWAKASEASALQAIASKAGGHATLFKVSNAGLTVDKANGAFQPLSPVLTKINQGLRDQLDPHQVFHTGRI
jgi:glycolate oxidase FAD binding subunit